MKLTPTSLWAGGALSLAAIFLIGEGAMAQDRSGPFSKLFGRGGKAAATAEAAAVTPASLTVSDQATGVDLYPELATRSYRATRNEAEVEQTIDEVYSEYEQKVANLTAADLQLTSIRNLPPVRSDFEAAWSAGVRQPFWSGGTKVRQDLVQVYGSALTHSNTVKVFSDLPLIRETAIQEARGEFDWRVFGQAQYGHVDEPTTSELTTGFSGRLLEDLGQLDYGMRRKIATGGEMSLSHRMNTLKSNSTFLDPNPQTGSELVFSLVQPLMRGGGYSYNRARLKIAKLDADLASAEYLRALESHLIEVNRAYWEVYLARAAYLQKRALVTETESLVDQLEDREGVDAEATRSELLRARSSLTQRQASLIRGEMAIRNAEERLRALVNDPEFAMGSGGEFIPLTRPVLSRPASDVKETALAALYHRPEVVQGFYQLKAAGIRREIQKQDMKPQLNLLIETKVAGLDEGRSWGDPIHDQFAHGTGWNGGFTYEQSLERNLEIARMKRREYEFRQQVSQLKGTIDQVLLEAVTTYRELMTAYRDMQGRYQSVLASREEIKELKERLDVDTDNERQTVGYQLQLILDALERNQIVEEQFLVSMVAYNSAFATVERAKGTLLEYYDIDIVREREGTWKRHRMALDSLHAGFATPDHDANVMSGDEAQWSRHRDALDQLKSERGMK